MKTPFREVYGVFSPDGQWVAYKSDESGRAEDLRAAVCPARPGGHGGKRGCRAADAGVHRRRHACPSGGLDGKELYYLNPAGAMMAVPITVIGSTLEAGVPGVLFPTRIYGGGVDAQQGRQYDVAPDGRFLINTVLDSGTVPITLLQNWNPEAKR